VADDDERPQYQHGVGTIGGTQFYWGSGTPGKYWSIPYGDYPVTPDAPTGAWAHSVGAIPIANNIIPDPVLNRNRVGIMIHSGSAPALDQLYTQGCFKVDPQDWPTVRSQILAQADKGPLYLHVAPGGVAAFTNTKTFSQAGDETPAAAANATANTTAAAAAPAAPVLDNRSIFFNTLRQKAGLNPQQALGAMWGLGGESGPSLNTGAYNPNDPGGSVGAGQWMGPRRWQLEEYAQKQGKSVTDPQVQADFMAGELTGGVQGIAQQPGVLASLQKANTPEDAARVWTSQYERPTVDNSAARIAQGSAVGSLDAKGNFVPGTANASSTTAATPPGTTINTPGGAWAALNTQGAGGQSPLQKTLADAGKAFGGDQQQQQQQAPQPPDQLQAQQAAAGLGMQRQQQLAQGAQQMAAALQQRAAKPLSWGSAPPGTTLNVGAPAIGAGAGEQLGGAQAFLPQWEQWQRMSQYAPGLELTPPGMTLNSTGAQYGYG
jgi:hypothetical protein